jgi:hypothetical protein
VKEVPANTAVRVYDAQKKGTLLGSAQTGAASGDVEVVLANGLPVELSEVWVTFATVTDKDLEKGKDKAKETEPVAKHFLNGLLPNVELQAALKPGAHAFSTEVNLGGGHTASELSAVEMKFSKLDGTLLADVQTSAAFSANHAADTKIVGIASREQKATDVDADFTYSDWNGGVYDVPGQTAVTVTDREGNVYTASKVQDLEKIALDAVNAAANSAELKALLEDGKNTTVLGIETGAGSQYATVSENNKNQFLSSLFAYSQNRQGFSSAEVLRNVFTSNLKSYLKAPAIAAADLSVEHVMSIYGYGSDTIKVQNVPAGSEVNVYDSNGNSMYIYETAYDASVNGGTMSLTTWSDSRRTAYYVSIKSPEYGLESDRTVKTFLSKVLKSSDLQWAVVDGQLGYSAKASFVSPEIASQMTDVKLEMGRLAEWDYSTPIVFGTNTARNASQVVQGTDVSTLFSPFQKSTDTDPNWIHSDWTSQDYEVVSYYVTVTAKDAAGNVYKTMNPAVTDLDWEPLHKINTCATVADTQKLLEDPVYALFFHIDTTPTSKYAKLSPEKKLLVAGKVDWHNSNFFGWRRVDDVTGLFNYYVEYYTNH